MKYLTKSAKETQSVAAKIAARLQSGVIALNGELGAGKTTFIQGLGKALGIQDKFLSPTFVLIREHKIPDTDKMLYHIDLYRLEQNTEVKELGLEDLFVSDNNIILIEWANKITSLLPRNTVYIDIEKLHGDFRKISVQNFPS